MKKLLAAVAVALVLAILAGGLFWYKLRKPLYEPGDVRAGRSLRAPLSPPAQSAGPDYWNVEPDIRLYHWADGSGRNVLVIHGGPGYPFRSPLPGLRPLADRFRFHYYDQRGCGRSTRPFDRFSSSNYLDNVGQLEKTLGLGAHIADIERIRRLLGDPKLILFGHSFGGFIASLYAAEFPGNVEGLILAAPASLLVMPQEDGGLFEAIRRRLPERTKPAYSDFLKEYMDYGGIFRRSETELAALNLKLGGFYAAAAGQPEPVSLPGNGGWMPFATYFSMGMKHDYRAALRELRAPVLLLHGDKDMQPEAASRLYADSFSGARFRLLENCGHFAFNEQPTEFAREVGDFLSEFDSREGAR